MIRATSIHLRPSAGIIDLTNRLPTFSVAVDVWRELIKEFVGSYRPELHYMRGPGPKWRAKHGALGVNPSGAIVKTVFEGAGS